MYKPTLNIFPTNVVEISTKLLSTSTISRAIYPDHYVEPNPDRKTYFDAESSKDDDLSTKMIKAAPNTFTYSVFFDPQLYKFEKMILKRGKGAIASNILKSALVRIKTVQLKKYHAASPKERESIEVNPLVIFHEALEKATPVLGLNRFKRGGTTYQIPFALGEKKKFFLASTWLLSYIRSGEPRNTAGLRLGNELLAAYNNQGSTIKRKQALHKNAEANRAYINIKAG
uniref:Small ribosomal subunit protein uS7 domain-containing protein n=1 Tax=Ciona savignyi TaxID=51511 RepID=H2Z0K8_CIOSA